MRTPLRLPKPPVTAQRVGILVTGPNCSGKSTTVLTALEPWGADPRIVSILADNRDSRLFKDAPAVVEERLREVWLGSAAVVVVEGTDRPARALSRVYASATKIRPLVVLVTEQRPETMAAHIQARCAAKGKPYNAAYWDRDRLSYEGMRRYPSLVAKMGASYVYRFEIDPAYDQCRRMVETIRTLVQEGFHHG